MKQQILEILRAKRTQRAEAGYSIVDYDTIIAMIEAMPEPLTLAEQQRQFSGIAGYELPAMPVLKPDNQTVELRHRLIEEEAKEVLSELLFYRASNNAVNLARLVKELADLIYVAAGTAAVFGVDIDAVLAAVHRSNMSKAGAEIVAGKLQKGGAYEPPNIMSVIGADYAPF